jgi:hypothetical protein
MYITSQFAIITIPAIAPHPAAVDSTGILLNGTMCPAAL